MANAEHLKRLKQVLSSQDYGAWSKWRWSKTFNDGIFGEHPATVVDLSGVDFRKFKGVGSIDFTRADLRGAWMQRAFLLQTIFRRADLRDAHFESADLRRALFTGADMRGIHLRDAILDGADLAHTDLRGADLRGAWLNRTTLVGTKLQGADLTGCRVYGAGVWDAKTDAKTIQKDLIISSPYEDTPKITVDSLDVAQFIYLLLENERLRDVLDTISSKVVLILGRFSAPHKAVLDAVRDQLRALNLTPVIFDFEGPRSKNLTGTITTLAHMARFVVADITDPKSVPQELTEITHALPALPIQPILRAGLKEWSMFPDLQERGVVLPTLRYRGLTDLRRTQVPKIVESVERYLDQAADSPKAKVALVKENRQLQRSNAAKDREIAQLRERLTSR